ncbi:MAG TPA: glutathione S-transferase N-terminal domain-containing protein [Allosphingosinicella sp.]|nr:glutathione S-transferase N-terminal domain-containing protein [Allosphingosinicella sp.]
MTRLYYSPGACSLAPHIALEETGAPFEARRVSIADGANKEPDYLAVNPHGFVPALEADGEVIAENLAVMAYIAARHPQAALLPFADPPGLARAMMRMAFLASSVHIAYAQLWRPHRFTSDAAAHPAIVEGGRRRIVGQQAEIEAVLSRSRWFAGDAYTLADPYLLVFFRWGNRIGLDMGYPRWAAHSEAMLARPAVQRALRTEGLAAAEFLPRGG